MKLFIIVILASSVLTSCAAGGVGPQRVASPESLRHFETDFCSAYKEGPSDNPDQWKHCCIKHDIRYWRGGSYDERVAADRELMACVADTGAVNEPTIMYLGVRLGGGPVWRTSYRWGYGWPFAKGYTRLTRNDLSRVQAVWTDRRYEDHRLPEFLIDNSDAPELTDQRIR